jgi:hypothetical protein
MTPLFQLFEFSYPGGFLFYDRSGSLARRLQESFPGLSFKSSTQDQRDFVLAAEDLELFFGIALSRIQTLEPGHKQFPATASRFLQLVAEVLEINQLTNFHFRYVLGRPCETAEEAQSLMWPLVPEETKVKLSTVAPPADWRALQAEFLLGGFACESRTAVIDLVPHRKLAWTKTDSTKPVPHITFHADLRGLSPISVADFDAEAFMNNVRDKHTQDMLSKLAPHLS